MIRDEQGRIHLNRQPKAKAVSQMILPDPPTIPCRTCGNPTPHRGTGKCNRCWAIEGQLDEYLSTPGGKARVVDALRRAGYRVFRPEAADETPGKTAVRQVLADMNDPNLAAVNDGKAAGGTTCSESATVAVVRGG